MDNPKIKPEMYWEWRFHINAMDIAKRNVEVAVQKYELMQKDIEIARLRAIIFKDGIGALQEKESLAKKAYEDMKARIEADVGMSLNNCVIDDYSFEIKKLDDTTS